MVKGAFPPAFPSKESRPPKIHGNKAAKTRGPRELQGSLYTNPQSPVPLPPPPTWKGPTTEWAVYWGHLRLGLVDGLDFSYQLSAEGGRLGFGGLVIDFVELNLPIAINVQGEYFHYRDAKKILNNQLAKVQLAHYGVLLVFIDGQDALANPVYYVREALAGIDHSRGGH